MRLDGKVGIVSGANQGIGRATALRWAEEGATVVCADIKEECRTHEEIEEKGGTAITVVMDVRVADDWRRLVETTVERFGTVDLLANVAGVVNMLSPDTVVGLTEEAWDNVVGTDLKGVWLGMRAVIPTMQANGGGRIVNISSLAALRGLPNLASYSAAKGGVIALTQQAAFEYGPDNILINAIAPGTIDTPILADITDEMRAANARAHIINRLGKPEEIAAMATFFCTADADFLTGLTYPVDGGWSVKGNY
ncbi:SDR family NAD(P)-dependent oxidoreductase [Desertimonas flava]|uniref:SDR family NAD(P)-dependent oxidoreductase n=1 Tax=Desertimonas flava TaxID=2064846 RepID=UPI000E34129F|nr:SDR family oxidoreductase [Desertimonas flava]